MGDYRSRSYSEGVAGGMEMENYYTPTTTTSSYAYNDYRSYSASYDASSSSPTSSSYAVAPPPPPPPLPALPPPRPGAVKEKVKSTTRSKSWSFVDPEFRRKKRVASYKAYSVEGKVKGSLRKSFRWVKDKCSQVVYGWR